MGIAQREPDRIVRKLVDKRDAVANTMIGRARIQGPDVIHFVTNVGGDGAVPEFKRANRTQVGRTGQTLADQGRIRRLVDNDTGQKLGRILIELDAAIITRCDLLATIQKRRREVRSQPTDRNDLAAPVKALSCQTRQSRQRFRDRDIRQLADVLGGHDLDDRGVIALGRDGILDPRTDAGDNDLLDLGHGSVRPPRSRLRLGSAGHPQNDGDSEGTARHQARTPAEVLSHLILPWPSRFW